MRRRLEAGAAACLRALERAGHDVAAYDVAEMAREVVDLASAFGIERTDLIGYGASSRVVLQVLRTAPDRVSAAFLDSPELPGKDPRALAGPATRAALLDVLELCTRDPHCRARHPRPGSLLRRGLVALAGSPITLRVRNADGRVRLRLDPAMLLRLARQSLNDSGSSGQWGLPGSVPALLDAAAHRDRRTLTAAASALVGRSGPLCVGYRPKCLLPCTG